MNITSIGFAHVWRRGFCTLFVEVSQRQGTYVMKLCSLLYTITGATAHTGAYFGEGSGPIHLDFVQCSGSEYNLTECEIRHDRISIDHSFDVGVKCQPGRTRVVFCVNGSMTTHTFKRLFSCSHN